MGMYKRITIERNYGSLMRREWRFTLMDGPGEKITIVLDYFCEYQRPTKRHKFRTHLFWNRLFQRDSTIERSSVPIDGGIYAEVRRKIVASLVFEEIVPPTPTPLPKYARLGISVLRREGDEYVRPFRSGGWRVGYSRLANGSLVSVSNREGLDGVPLVECTEEEFLEDNQ